MVLRRSISPAVMPQCQQAERADQRCGGQGEQRDHVVTAGGVFDQPVHIGAEEATQIATELISAMEIKKGPGESFRWTTT